MTEARLAEMYEAAIAKLERTSRFAKPQARSRLLDIACRVLAEPDGAKTLYASVQRLEAAELFVSTDWDHPEILQPSLAVGTLDHGDHFSAALEMLSELRLLAVARQELFHPRVSSEQARHFLAQVLALNLNRLFGTPDEAERARGSRGVGARRLVSFIAESIGYENVFDELITEIERILAQRPIMVDGVKTMITRIAICRNDQGIDLGNAGGRADQLVAALYGPTPASHEDPGLDVYAERLAALEPEGLLAEAQAAAASMHATGIVSAYHATLLRQLNAVGHELVGVALGLSSTGQEALACYRELVAKLIDAAITADTAQAIYGLAQALERGLLFDPAIAPGLWGQINLQPSQAVRNALAANGKPGDARTQLLSGVLSLLGQPLGIGQGNNPTCQAARALSMWAVAAPDYLLYLMAHAVRDDEIFMIFEGRRLSSAKLGEGLAVAPPTDVDPVSIVLVPHLDRIYAEMGRICAGRRGDPHAWVNREMHGWWVGRETMLAVDIATGQLNAFETFVRRFYAHYHPLHNGNQPVIHPQPAGVAATDSRGRFIGWHAITILRIGLGPEGETRVFFFNPNNDSGQDLGGGVVVSTERRGERHGEASLPIAQFTSRLYLFHYDPSDEGDMTSIPEEEVAEVERLSRGSWASGR